MEKLRQSLSKLPPALFSIIVILAILWLTLAPKPLGEEPPMLFEGADKIVHAIMFGGLSIILLLDWQRSHNWRRISLSLALSVALISSLFGVAIEFLQSYMNLGRGFEYADMIADTSGAFIFALSWLILQKNWLPKNH